jgi:hypothetical protein
MICNKCGAENDDGLRFCANCGHKLRSRERPAESGPEQPADTQAPDRPEGTGPGNGVKVGEPGETGPGPFLSFLDPVRPPAWREWTFAWGLALLLAGAALWAVLAGVFWPLYPLLAAAALFAWRRRL